MVDDLVAEGPWQILASGVRAGPPAGVSLATRELWHELADARDTGGHRPPAAGNDAAMACPAHAACTTNLDDRAPSAGPARARSADRHRSRCVQMLLVRGIHSASSRLDARSHHERPARERGPLLFRV